MDSGQALTGSLWILFSSQKIELIRTFQISRGQKSEKGKAKLFCKYANECMRLYKCCGHKIPSNLRSL